MNIESMNKLRFNGQRGHVESYFMRANHPTEQQAVWIRVTIFSPLKGKPLLETGLVWFDGREVVSVQESREIVSGVIHPNIGTDTLRNGLIYGNPTCAWHLVWQSMGLEHEPLCLFPYDWMVDGWFPRSKLLTPQPVVKFEGELQIGDRDLNIDGWLGMQGHNWGKEHAHRYVWGQCIFDDGDCMLEGFTGQIKLGPVTSPSMSSLVVRRRGVEYRFDDVFRLWKQSSSFDMFDLCWRLRMSSKDGKAYLYMQAPNNPAFLEYKNPDGSISHCINSKIADTYLEVRPRNGKSFSCGSGMGALEFLSSDVPELLKLKQGL